MNRDELKALYLFVVSNGPVKTAVVAANFGLPEHVALEALQHLAYEAELVSKRVDRDTKSVRWQAEAQLEGWQEWQAEQAFDAIPESSIYISSDVEYDHPTTNPKEAVSMPAVKTRKGAKTTAAKAKGAKPKSVVKSSGVDPKEAAAAKRAAAAEADATATERILELRETDPVTPWGEIAEELSITPGKAQFLVMKHTVSKTPKLKLRFKTDEELAEQIVAAREAADAYSSWGWIAARTGVNEGRVKKIALDAGVYEPGASNIASLRAGSAEPEQKPSKAAKSKAPVKTAKTAAKAKAATKRPRAKKAVAADPSK